MYLVDTNILIWLIRGNPIYVQWFEDLKEDETLIISTITVAELYKNILPEEFVNTEEIINKFEILDVNRSIAKIGGLYWQQYSKKLAKLHILDCLIAATAKDNNLVLITLNARHFPMGDIQVMDPLKTKLRVYLR